MISKGQAAFGLVIVSIASALLPISLTGASVALPGVADSFHNGLAAGQWVVNGYDLTFASFMLAAGSFADLFGRRRMFLTGSLVFAVSSLISAAAGNVLVLDVARTVAGLGGAMLLTAGSAMLAHLFDGAARARAFGVFGTAIGVGLAFGPFIAGSLSTAFGWRTIFLVPGLVGLLIAACCLRLPESSDPAATRVDWAGTLTFTGALTALILALLEGPQLGWAGPLTITAYVLTAVLLIAFVAVERRQARPMFDLGLFAQPQYLALCVAVLALVFAFTPLLVYLPTYFVAVNGASTLHAGVDLMMLTVPTLIFPMVAGYLLRWVPIRHMVTLSVALTAGGAAWLTVLGPRVGNWVVLGPFLLIGTGVGISFGCLDGAAVSSVDPARAGMAAGMFNTVRLAGETIAIAVVGTLLVSATRGGLGDQLGRFGGRYAQHPADLANALNQGDLAGPVQSVPAASRAAFTDVAVGAYTGALHTVLWVMAVFCAVAAVALLLIQRAPEKPEQAAPAGAEPVGAEPAATTVS